MKDPEERISVILADWQERHARGEAEPPDEVIRRHPDLADDLRARFAVMDLVDRVFAETHTTPPEQLGDFRILREIGRGGMGVVYEADQTSMGRRVALKVLSAGITASENAVARFRQEARAAGRLHHTNIVSVHSLGREGESWYYAMELVEGRPLGLLIEDLKAGDTGEAAFGAPTGTRECYSRIAELFAGVADALEAVHKEGVIHRDVKPGNLILDDRGILKVADFGLARMAGERSPGMTASGTLVGTPLYMSPEQAHAEAAVDHRTDIYSLGATLYEVLTLKPPVSAQSVAEACTKVISEEPPAPRRLDPRIPKYLETVVEKAMAKDRAHRYDTAAALAEDLRRFAMGAPIRARRAGPLARAIRTVRRHRPVAALVAALLLLSALTAAVTLHYDRQARAGGYDLLCARAEVALYSPDTGFRVTSPGLDPGTLFSRAIDLDPDRWEAWLLRSQLTSNPVEERLADLEKAGRLGAPEGTVHMGRALVLAQAGRAPDSEREETLALTTIDPGPLFARLRAHLLLARGDLLRGAESLHDCGSIAEASPARTPAEHRRRARERELAGDLAGALADLDAIIREGAGDVETRVRAAWLIHRLGGRDAEAGERFERVLADVSRRGTEEAWLTLAEVCAAIWKADWSDRATEEALRARPGSTALRAARCVSLFLLDRYEEAAALAGDDAPVVKARSLLKLDRPEEALEVADRGLANGPDAHLFRVRGDALLALGRLNEALTEYDRAVAAAPGSWHCRVNRSYARRLVGRFEDALADCRAAFAACPDHPAAYAHLAYTLNLLGRYGEAGRVVGLGLRRFPTAVELHLYGAEADLMKTGPGLALARMKRVKDQLPYGYGIALIDAWRPAEALPYLAGEDAEITFQRGRAHFEAGHLEKAAAAFREVTGRRELVVLARRHLALALACLGDFAGAEAELTAADECLPGYVRSRIPALHALLTMGRYDEVLAGAQELVGDEARARSWFQVRALRAKGETESARNVAHEVLYKEPPLGDEHLRCAYLAAVAGKETIAWRMLGNQDVRPPFRSYETARVYAVMGEKEKAAEWLEKAAQAGCRAPVSKVPDPDFAAVFEAWSRLERP